MFPRLKTQECLRHLIVWRVCGLVPLTPRPKYKRFYSPLPQAYPLPVEEVSIYQYLDHRQQGGPSLEPSRHLSHGQAHLYPF